MIRRPPRSTLFPHDALPISISAVFLFPVALASGEQMLPSSLLGWGYLLGLALVSHAAGQRSEEHTSELQSQSNIDCVLLLENKTHHSVRSATQLLYG